MAMQPDSAVNVRESLDRLQRWDASGKPMYMGISTDLGAVLLPLTELLEAARALYEQVEMDESVGICLSDRVPALNLGRVLQEFEANA